MKVKINPTNSESQWIKGSQENYNKKVLQLKHSTTTYKENGKGCHLIDYTLPNWHNSMMGSKSVFRNVSCYWMLDKTLPIYFILS
jgi:hypothetical protein